MQNEPDVNQNYIEFVRMLMVLRKSVKENSPPGRAYYLTTQELKVIIWIFYTKLTYRRIAWLMGVSFQRVEQIRKKALSKIRTHLK